MSSQFHPYLESIRATYEKWWQLYTLTNAAGKERQAKQGAPTFDFGLMVQTVKKEDRREEEKIERFPVLEGIRKYAEQHVLLVGRPGSGKSTALARLMLEEATIAPSRLPVLVELRYWQGSIEQLIRDSFTRHDLPAELFEEALKRSLLLFDGMNELPSEEARSQLFAFRRNHPKLPMIFTTRDLSLGGDLGIGKKLEMQPLAEAQMQTFIRSYVPEQADQMLRQLKDRLREFGQTPLLLWMLCEVIQQSPDSTLPRNLGEIFRVFTEAYEQSSVRKHEVAALKGDVKPLSDRRLWKKALKALAFLMIQGKTPVDPEYVIPRGEAEEELSRIFPNESFPVRDLLDDLLKYHLLQIKNADQIEFRHQLIQEYYAAETLLERVDRLEDDQLKRDFLNFLKWEESATLMLSLMNDEQAKRLVKLALEVDLMLGARLSGKVSDHLQENIIELISCLDVQFIEDTRKFGEGADQTIRAVDGRTLAQSLRDEYFERNPKMKELVELGLIVGLPQFSDALKVRLLSASGSRAAIPKLVEALEQAIEQENHDILNTAIIGLVKNSSVEKIPVLVDFFLHQEVFDRSLINILVDTATEDSEQILQSILENCSLQTSSELSDWISQRLHLLATVKQFDEVSPFYLENLYFSNNEARAWLYQLSESGKDGNESSIRLLIDTLKDTKAPYELRGDALNALRRIKNHPQVALAVFEMLDDELCECITGVHSSVLDGIGELGDITMLIPLFEHMFYTLGNLDNCWDEEWDKVLKALASIQSRYQFYNYKIYQAYLEAQKDDRHPPQNHDRSFIFPNATEVKIFENVDRYYETNSDNKENER